MACDRCGGQVMFDKRDDDRACIACGARVLSEYEIERAQAAVLMRERTGRGGRYDHRIPSSNGIMLD